MKHVLRIMVFATIVLFMIHNSLFIIPVYAQEDNIGQSRIHPASPFYFLKSVREILELKFAGTSHVRAVRQLEFATRRLREVKSLVSTPHQDLIAPTLERYWFHLGELKGIIALRDENMVRQISQAVIQHMQTLQTVYEQVSDPGAKRSIRSLVYRLSEWDQELIEKLDLVNQSSFIQQIATSKLLGCNFLSKEASNSALNEVEKTVLKDRIQACLKL